MNEFAEVMTYEPAGGSRDKEESVHAHEADDAVNWALIATVIIGLSGQVNVGPAVGPGNGSAQVGMYNVGMQESNADSDGLTQLPGNPDDPVDEAIPDLRYVPQMEDYEPGPEGFTGELPTAVNIIHLGFTSGTTVAQANQLLSELDAVIVGGIKGRYGPGSGHLTIRVPTRNFTELLPLYDALKLHLHIAGVMPGVILGPVWYELSPEDPGPGDSIDEEEPGADGLTQLPGDPNDPANEAIPDLVYRIRPEDVRNDQPELPGVWMSYNTVRLMFEFGTTVAEANAILREIGAEIVGGFPGIETVGRGTLGVRLPARDFVELEAVIALLETKPEVYLVAREVAMGIPYPIEITDPDEEEEP